jgi:hypothetical protein
MCCYWRASFRTIYTREMPAALLLLMRSGGIAGEESLRRKY